ncbi:MFS transporter [Streptomyces sp. 8N616]|uniref:MFS transporter n=1 Tax=Streptomyces sp. 8N616 TaxID=3457414 RepID=UPI003FD573F7
MSSPMALVAARVVQGVGAAAMFATTLSLLGSVYQGRQRSVALGLWGAVSGAAAAIGPVVGGLLTEGPGWRWIFFVNLPVSTAALWLDPAHRARIACGVGLANRLGGHGGVRVLRGGDEVRGRTGEQLRVDLGEHRDHVRARLARAHLLRARRTQGGPSAAGPIVFRKPVFVGVMAGALAFNAAAFAVAPYTSIWLQTVLGLSPVHGGLTVLPLAATAFVAAVVGGCMLHGVQPRLTIGVGLALIDAGTLAQAVLDAGSSWTALLPGLVLAGVGTGLVSPALAGAALAAVPAERAGMAGGAVNTFRQFGYAFGVAVFGTVLISVWKTRSRAVRPMRSRAAAHPGCVGLRACAAGGIRLGPERGGAPRGCRRSARRDRGAGAGAGAGPRRAGSARSRGGGPGAAPL